MRHYGKLNKKASIPATRILAARFAQRFWFLPVTGVRGNKYDGNKRYNLSPRLKLPLQVTYEKLIRVTIACGFYLNCDMLNVTFKYLCGIFVRRTYDKFS